ncbi:MAG: cyclic nucleotide-binding domain-containing protein [Gaiellaceae bacterium]|jgi:CRP-like cAMP-binding protein
MTPDQLRAIPLFAGVSDAGLERIAARAGEIACEPGQVLAVPGDPGSGMFVILEGYVTVEARGTVYGLGEGDFFGELALLNPDAERVARVRARSEVRCLALPRDDALALIEAEPALALAMLKELARRLADAVDRSPSSED